LPFVFEICFIFTQIRDICFVWSLVLKNSQENVKTQRNKRITLPKNNKRKLQKENGFYFNMLKIIK